MSLSQTTVRCAGPRVLILTNGVLTADLEWSFALNLGQAIVAKARQAEEFAKAEKIIPDQALLTRVGAPFGLSNNPKILKQAFKDAQWMHPPGAIEPTSVVGTPALTQHSPRALTPA